MLKKVVKKLSLNESSSNEDVDYWLKKSPEERVSAVEILRQQIDGSTARLQKVAKVIQRAPR